MARVDKFLWAVRKYKTRSLATEACKKGRIKVNGAGAKPSKEISEGDIILFQKQGIKFQLKVKELLNNRVGAKLVSDYVIDITEKEELDKLDTLMAAQKSYKSHGTGKPSKKDRRDINQFWDDF